MSQSRMGRPTKGDRRQFITRVPRVGADLVEAAAAERGLSLSDYISLVLCQHHGLDVKMPEPDAQEALPLQNVS